MRWTGHVARIEEGRSAFKILTGTLAGKRPVVRPRLRWEENIRMDLKEIEINTGNWIDSTPDRDYWRALVNAALKLLYFVHNYEPFVDMGLFSPVLPSFQLSIGLFIDLPRFLLPFGLNVLISM